MNDEAPAGRWLRIPVERLYYISNRQVEIHTNVIDSAELLVKDKIVVCPTKRGARPGRSNSVVFSPHVNARKWFPDEM